MKNVFLLLLIFCLSLAANSQVLPASKIAHIQLPATFKQVSINNLPSAPSNNNLLQFSPETAKDEYYESENITIQTFGYETGLTSKQLQDTARASKEPAAQGLKRSRLTDFRTINNHQVLRTVDESNPDWGSLMVIVQNHTDTRRIHINVKYPKAQRMKSVEAVESMIESIQFK